MASTLVQLEHQRQLLNDQIRSTQYYDPHLHYKEAQIANQIKHILQNEQLAREYESQEKIRSIRNVDSTRYKSPRLNLMFNVSVGGSRYRVHEDNIITLDRSGNLVEKQMRKVDQSRIDEIKAELYRTENELNESRGQRSRTLYLEQMSVNLKNLLKKERQIAGVTGLFLPLAKLSRNVRANAFLNDYFEAPKKSFRNVEANIDILLTLLFKGKRDIVFQNEKLHLVNYSWRKKEYPPYGYQTSRGKTELRLLLNSNNLRWLNVKNDPHELKEEYEEEYEDEKTIDPKNQVPRTRPLKSILKPGSNIEPEAGSPAPPAAPPAVEPAAHHAKKRRLKGGGFENKDMQELLELIKEQEETIEQIFSSMHGGGLINSVKNSAAFGSKILGQTLGSDALVKSVSNGLQTIGNKVTSSINDQLKTSGIANQWENTSDFVMTAANRAQAYGSDLWTKTNVPMPNLIRAEILTPDEALKDAYASYNNTIDLNSHSFLRFPAFLYPTRDHLFQPYIYEYLAYRFTIYHNWFNGGVWTFYSILPYFISEKKNSILLRDLVPYSPTVEIRDATVRLAKLWNYYEIDEDLQLAESKHKTQMMYLQRLRLDLLRRLDLFRSAYNYVALKVLLAEVRRCPHRDKVKTCMAKSQEIIFSDFAQSDYQLNYDTKVQGEDEDVNACSQATDVVVPLIWDDAIKTNGLQKPPVDFIIDKSKISDFSDSVIHDSLENGIEKLEEVVNGYKKSIEVNAAVTLNHVLPDICQCLFGKIKQIQRNRVQEQMEEMRKDWSDQASYVLEKHQAIRMHMNKSCYTVLAQTGDETSDCGVNLNVLQEEVKYFSKQLLDFVSLQSESTIASFWEETYPSFYGELKELHEKYVTLFGNYMKVFNDLVTTLQSISDSNVSYDRAVAQLDYVADAYNTFADIAVPLDLVTLEPRPETNIMNFKSVVSNLATLCDILEDKIFRGYVSNNSFPMFPDEYGGNEDEQEEFLKIVEDYAPSRTESIGERQAFLQAFASLDAEYVLHHNDPNNLTPAQSLNLFEKAKKYWTP